VLPGLVLVPNGPTAGLKMRIESRHPLDDPFPSFLARLNSESDRARAEFGAFAYRLLAIRPPRVFGMVGSDRRDDLIQDVLLHCLRDDCRVLRTYRDHGRPFAAWLLCVAANVALSRASKYSLPPYEEPAEVAVAPRERDPLLVDMIEKSLGSMGQKCQFLLRLLADGFKPTEMVEPARLFLGMLEYSNKQVSDDLRYCKSVLRNLIMDAGVDVEVL
jgi:hypothetical protein